MVKPYRLGTWFSIFGVSIALLLFVTNPFVSKAQLVVTSLNPIADTYVASDSPTTVRGTDPTLQVDGSPMKIIYIKYDLSSLIGLSISSAKLRFKVVDSSSSVQTVKQVSDTSWSETAITYNARPALGSPLTTLIGGKSGTFVELDVTAYVNAKLGQIVSFGIDSTGSDGLDFNSREATTDKPTLVINSGTVSASPTPSITPRPSATPVPSPTPTPDPSSGSDPVIAAGGDVACGSTTSTSYPCKQKETSDVLLQINPTAVLALGDLQYNSGKLVDFQNYYEPTWGRVKAKTYPAVGNHEYGTSGAGGYFDYFNGVGAMTGRAGVRGQGYYSFDVGTWHIISLNSNCTKIVGGCAAGGAQEQWLRADLAAHQTQCTLAFWHHPRFSSGLDGSPITFSPFWQALYDYNADLVLVGHSHDYERFAPQRTDGTKDLVRGIREFVVGTGGRDFSGWTAPIAPNSEARQNTIFGVLKLTLHATSYDWRFMPIAGSTYSDSGTQQCH